MKYLLIMICALSIGASSGLYSRPAYNPSLALKNVYQNGSVPKDLIENLNTYVYCKQTGNEQWKRDAEFLLSNDIDINSNEYKLLINVWIDLTRQNRSFRKEWNRDFRIRQAAYIVSNVYEYYEKNFTGDDVEKRKTLEMLSNIQMGFRV